ncbi:MAG: ThuA domain-containing protein [Planctomycetota bacterium]|nr:ThuA domain-containing protein [Planctomycetota bacterium]
MKNFRPKFSEYDVVISNYNGDSWSAESQEDLLKYVKSGGGLVIVHAANNSFGDWKEYNRMIGLGGWGGRNEKHGPYIYLQDDKVVRDDSPGSGGHHGAQHPFQVVIRDDAHPVTAGMPGSWLHEKDELYDKLRGPGENMKILATSYADPKFGGSGRHEPMIFTVDYGQGRVFHTPMGHSADAMKCVGFEVTLQRGAEWAATGKVTQRELPKDFPTANKVSTR